jgi:nucleoredoxin
MLVDFYQKVNQITKKIEIIYVNSDEDPASFHALVSEIPWLAIPFNDSRVMELK